MKKSEKVLLGIFAALFLVLIGGGGGMMAFKNYLEVREEVASLRDRLADMNLAISQGAEWADASAKLLEKVMQEAEKLGLSIGGKEFVEQTQALGPDGLPVEEELGYFDQATVKTTLTGVQEQAFFSWLHTLQQPKSFIGVTRVQINPSGTNKTINAEVEFTQFYHEKTVPKVTKAN
jgi:cell division protein FtsL